MERELNTSSNLDPDVAEFAYRLSRAMKDISSSHVFFIMQQSYGEIAWEDVDKILIDIQKKTETVSLYYKQPYGGKDPMKKSKKK